MAEPDDGVLTGLLLAFRDFAQPVIDACASPEAMEFLWYRHGWRISLDDGGFAQLGQVLPIGTLGRELEQVADAVAAQRDSGSPPSPDDVVRLTDAAVTLAETLTALQPTSLADLAGPLGDAATWEDLGEQLFDTLLEQYLREHHPVLYGILLLTGWLRYDAVPAAPPARNAFVRAVFDWDQPRGLLRDPIAALAATYRWGDPSAPFDHELLLDVLHRVLRLLGPETDPITPALQLEPGLPAETAATIRTDVDGLRVTILHGVALGQHVTYEVGVDVLPAGPAGGGPPSGLVLRPRLLGGVTQAIPIGRTFTLRTSVDASVGDVLGVSLFPDDATLTGGDVTAGTAVELAAATADPIYLVGAAGSPRIELRNPTVRVSLEGTAEDAELRLRIGAGGGPGAGGIGPGARVVIPMGQADSFVRDSAGPGDIEVSFSPELIWSSRTGFAVNGSATPTINLPLSIRVGSFTLRNATIALVDATADGRAAYRLRVGTDIAGSIGPVVAVVQGLGFAADLVAYSRAQLRALPPGARRPALGNLDVDLSFAPPTGAGLSVDAAGVITGGGFLVHDADADLYAGVLDLSLHESLTLKAIGLISTRMPDGSAGYSVLVLITAEDFEPIPLGMGFSLLGIGGLVGIHRTFDDAAMRASLKAGSLGSILFPADPIGNAPAVIRALGSVFPARRGSYLLGLMAKVGRTTPPITMDLAVVYEFGARHRLIVLGRISSLMPTPKEDLVRIQLDAVGVIDLDAGTVAIDAVLVDSRLARKYALSGAMALRARLRGGGSGPAFVLAVGGFNPHYTPPAGIPAMDRVAIALSTGDNPQFICEAYVALTSNSVQFGARAHAHAAAYGFSIDGDVGFDVLVQRNPFGFIADYHASVQLKHGSTNLFTVTFDGQLQGPRPLRLSGRASFEVFWCDFSVHFDRTLVSGEPPPLPPGADVVEELARALADARNWATRRPANRQPGVSLRTRPPGAPLLVDPLGVLTVTQQVVPLNTGRDIDLFGDAPLTGIRRFAVAVALDGDGQHTDPVLDHFAPSQFFDLTDDEKIAGPAFERLQSGMSVGTEAAGFDDAEVVPVTLDYATLVMDDLTAPPRRLADSYPVDGDRLRAHLRLSALTQAALRTTGRARFRDDSVPAGAVLNRTRWTLVSVADDGIAAPVQPDSYSEGVAAAGRLNQAGDGAGWQLVRRFEGVR